MSQSVSEDNRQSGRLIYVSGGCRSGKSRFAQDFAEQLSGRRVYLATCPVIDSEMGQRIQAHQQARLNKGWATIEEPLDPALALAQSKDCEVVLIDCLTLWVNNLLFAADQQQRELTESEVETQSLRLIRECRRGGRTIILVSNELGMGLVPADPLSRRYRDLIGRCNQVVARHADEAYFLVSGLPLQLK